MLRTSLPQRGCGFLSTRIWPACAAAFCLAWLALPPLAAASMRILYQDPAELFLFEKIGKSENLVDNPARFNKLPGILVEQSVDAHLATTEPYDPVFRKETRDELIDESTQMAYPIPGIVTLNLGYRYRHDLVSDDSTSSLDQTHIGDADKSFLREINGAVAGNLGSAVTAGYAFLQTQDDNFVDMSSDLATPFTYANATASTRHTLGVIIDHWEAFAAFESGTYAGKYNQLQEADFLTHTLSVNLRYILGEVDKENVTFKASYSNSNFTQRQLAFGRADYNLDFLNNQARMAAYYDLPKDLWEGALGFEASYADRYKFDADTYGWLDYQAYAARVPLLLSAKVFSFLKVWAEVDGNYSYDSFAGNKAYSLQNSWGVCLEVPFLEINVYTFPLAGASWAPGTQGEQASFKLGFNAKFAY